MPTLFKGKKNPFFEYDMNELNKFLKKNILPYLREEEDKDKLNLIFQYIKFIREKDEKDGQRVERMDKINELLRSATPDRVKLLDEQAKIRSEMINNKNFIAKYIKMLEKTKKEFYRDNKKIIDDELKKISIEVSAKVKAMNEERISKAKATAEQKVRTKKKPLVPTPRSRTRTRTQSTTASTSTRRGRNSQPTAAPPRRKLRDILALFEGDSQTRKPLSRTTSKRSVSKSRKGRRLSLPNLSQRGKSPTGIPKGNLANAAIEKLITGASDKQRKALFEVITTNKLEKAMKSKLPPQYLVDSEAVANLEEEQKKAQDKMRKKVAAKEYKEFLKNLRKKKEKLEIFEKELNEYKKAHQAKGSKVLGIPTEINKYIKRLNELAIPFILEKDASNITPQEIEYKKQYDKLNAHVQKLSKDYEESGETVAVGDAVLNAERAKLHTTQLQAQRELVEMAQESKAKAIAELKASHAAKEKRLKKEAATQDLQTIMGPGKSTAFGKKRRSKKGSKKKTTSPYT